MHSSNKNDTLHYKNVTLSKTTLQICIIELLLVMLSVINASVVMLNVLGLIGIHQKLVAKFI
jgi:hypothetical protein